MMVRRTQGLSSHTRGWVGRPGIALANTGPSRLKRSGTPIKVEQSRLSVQSLTLRSGVIIFLPDWIVYQCGTIRFLSENG